MVEYKKDCGFRKHLKVCTFKPEQCKGDGKDYGDYCHLYNLEWELKWLQAKSKSEYEDMLKLEKTLKVLKQTDKAKYKETKKQIRDKFEGIVYIGKAILYLKRTKGTLNKKEQTVADKLFR